MKNLQSLALVAGVMVLSAAGSPTRAPRPEAPDQFIVSDAWLVEHARDPKTAILDVEQDPSEFTRGAHSGRASARVRRHSS